MWKLGRIWYLQILFYYIYLDCIGTKDSCSPVGPHHGMPKKDDPYLIKKLIDQPIMSVGHLIIKPGEEKPPQIVNNHAAVGYLLI